MFLISLALAAVAAEAPPTQAACPATSVGLPAELASWSTPQPLAAAKSADATSGATLTLGQAADLALSPTPDMRYAIRPSRPGGSVSHGGMAQFTVAKAGTYRVVIDGAAWLDVIADAKSLESVSHGHGPDCSGIRKMVDFKLVPGRYLLQIAGNGAPKVRVLVTSVPAA